MTVGYPFHVRRIHQLLFKIPFHRHCDGHSMTTSYQRIQDMHWLGRSIHLLSYALQMAPLRTGTVPPHLFSTRIMKTIHGQEWYHAMVTQLYTMPTAASSRVYWPSRLSFKLFVIDLTCTAASYILAVITTRHLHDV